MSKQVIDTDQASRTNNPMEQVLPLLGRFFLKIFEVTKIYDMTEQTQSNKHINSTNSNIANLMTIISK